MRNNCRFSISNQICFYNLFCSRFLLFCKHLKKIYKSQISRKEDWKKTLEEKHIRYLRNLQFLYSKWLENLKKKEFVVANIHWTRATLHTNGP